MASETKSYGGADDFGSLGAYRLVAEIARGELTTVFLATRASGNGGTRRAVYKRMLSQFSDSPEWRALLVDEARLAAAVHHPNVVALLPDNGDADGAVLFEYIDGETLENLLARADISLKPKLLVPIFADVLRGLAAIHSATDADGAPLRAVHQAPRARHIMVGTDGGSRLIDLSQSISAGSKAARARAERLHVAYMAQEQALDPDNVDHRADLFVVGIALWEALTGERLFLTDAADQTFQNMLHREVPRASITGRKPPEAFDKLCARALQRDPTKRYQSAAEMLAALNDAGRAIGGPASAFEVGQWVMALAGGTLRARHSQAGGSNSTVPGPASVRPPSVGPAAVGPGAAHSASTVPPASLSSTVVGHPGHLVVSRPPKRERPSDAPGRSSPAPAAPQSGRGSDPASRTTAPPPPDSMAGAIAESAAKQSAASKPSTPTATPDTAVMRTVPVSNPPQAFGMTTMVGGHAAYPNSSSRPPGEGSPVARSRVHTIQNIAAISLPASAGSAAPASGSAAPASGSAAPASGSAAPASDSVEPPRPRSDAPTEILSAEQARALTAMISAGAAADAQSPTSSRQGRSTEQLFAMPGPQLDGDLRTRSPSLPEETVVGDREQMERDMLGASRSDAPARNGAGNELASDTASAPSVEIQRVATPSMRARRAPIEVSATSEGPGTALALGTHASRGVLEREARNPSGYSRAPAGRSMAPARDLAGLSALVFVPSLEGEDDGVWGSSPPEAGASPSAPPGFRSTTSMPPPSRRRLAWLAVAAAVAVAAVVLALGSQPTDDAADAELDDSEDAPSAPEKNAISAPLPAAPTAPVPSAVPSVPAPAVPIEPPPLTRSLPPAFPAPAAAPPAAASPAAAPSPTPAAPATTSSRRSSRSSASSTSTSVDASAGTPSRAADSHAVPDSAKPNATPTSDTAKPKDEAQKPSGSEVLPYTNPY